MRLHAVAVLAAAAACSSAHSRQEPSPAPTPVERADDPWAAKDTPATTPGPAAGNLNKLVIGGDNVKPQMGLFALSRDSAREVDAEMKQGLEPAYRLAQKLAVKAWAGDRNFCEDAVRQTIGFWGIDGMLDAGELKQWKTRTLDQVRRDKLREINERHYEMIGEHDEAGCEKTLGIYVEGLQLAARDHLVLRNFGY